MGEFEDFIAALPGGETTPAPVKLTWGEALAGLLGSVLTRDPTLLYKMQAYKENAATDQFKREIYQKTLEKMQADAFAKQYNIGDVLGIREKEIPAPPPGEGLGMFPVGGTLPTGEEEYFEKKRGVLGLPLTTAGDVTKARELAKSPKRETKEVNKRLWEIPEKGQAIPITPVPEEELPYKIGHIQQFNVGDETIYKEYMGKDAQGRSLWADRPELVGKSGKNLFDKKEDAQKEANAMYESIPSREKAGVIPATEWVNGKYKPVLMPDITKRIPEWIPAPGMVGVGFTRRGNKFVDSATNKELSPDEIKEKYGEGAFLSAMKSSLQVQEKAYGMMDGFIRNLNGQVDRMKQITADVKRYDSRLLNIPLIEWRRRVKGTAYENIIDMYVTEISTEMGKIASGSQASVRELSVQTREKWEKIHDFKLPIGEMMKVLEETRHAANIRQKGSKEAIIDTRKRLLNEIGMVPEGQQGNVPIEKPLPKF